MSELEFEHLGDFHEVGRLCRCKVPGGWLYVLIALSSFQRNMVFVPDPPPKPPSVTNELFVETVYEYLGDKP